MVQKTAQVWERTVGEVIPPASGGRPRIDPLTGRPLVDETKHFPVPPQGADLLDPALSPSSFASPLAQRPTDEDVQESDGDVIYASSGSLRV